MSNVNMVEDYACNDCSMHDEKPILLDMGHEEEEDIPEDYIKPGNNSLLYVNAYAVTRHYGGPQEGGWWYNHSEPLASIPMKAISKKGHSNCWQCTMSKYGHLDSNGKKYKECKYAFHLEPVNKKEVKKTIKYLHDCFDDKGYGDIYSVNGGKKISVCVEDFPAWETPQDPPTWE